MSPKAASSRTGSACSASHTVLDLVQHYPRRYLDRTKRAAIADMREGEEATVVGRGPQGQLPVLEGRAGHRRGRSSPTGRRTCTSPSSTSRGGPAARQWAPRSSLFGKLERYRGRLQMTNPVVDVLGSERRARRACIVPIYPQSGKADVTTWQLQRLMSEALDRAGELADPLPEELRDATASSTGPGPTTGSTAPRPSADHYLAARRLIFDEFLRMQVGLVARKRAFETTGRASSSTPAARW